MIIYFEIIGDKLSLEKEEIIENIIISLDGIKFIHKNQPFNDWIKEQQKYNKHILVDFIPKPLDELKFIVKAIYNFLVETNQISYFMIDCVEMVFEKNKIIVYATELLRENLQHNTTFSPTVRSCWENPRLIEKILRLP